MVDDSPITVVEIANRTGWARNSIYAWKKEENEHNITLDYIIQLGKVTGLNPKDYFPIEDVIAAVNEPSPTYASEREQYLFNMIDSLLEGNVAIEDVKEELSSLVKENNRYRKELVKIRETLNSLKSH